MNRPDFAATLDGVVSPGEWDIIPVAFDTGARPNGGGGDWNLSGARGRFAWDSTNWYGLIEAYLADPPEVVISVCERAAQSCPPLPGATERIRWSFPDPAEAQGDATSVAVVFGAVRDAIRARIEEWLAGR